MFKRWNLEIDGVLWMGEKKNRDRGEGNFWIEIEGWNFNGNGERRLMNSLGVMWFLGMKFCEGKEFEIKEFLLQGEQWL